MTVVDAFLEGAAVVTEALASEVVAARWEASSVLEDQTVGGLAGHLARSGVWVVGDYLDGQSAPGAVSIESAGEYFWMSVDRLTADDHRAIRARGAQIAIGGHNAVVAAMRERLPLIAKRLRAVGPRHRLTVIGGAVMELDEYLRTRIVEQVVHLDDVARSVDVEPWQLPAECVQTALMVGLDVGVRRSGAAPMLRALYRSGFASRAMPVI